MMNKITYQVLCMGVILLLVCTRIIAQDVTKNIEQLEQKSYLTIQEREQLKRLYDEQMKHIEYATMRGIYFDPERARAGAQAIEHIRQKRETLDLLLPP